MIGEITGIPSWAVEEILAIETMARLLDYKVKLTCDPIDNGKLTKLSIETEYVISNLFIMVFREMVQVTIKIHWKKSGTYNEIRGLEESIETFKELI